MTPEEYVQRLIEISNSKHRLLQDMLELTKAQSQTITEDGIDGLEGLIADEQKRIEAVDKLDEAFNVYFERLKQTLKIKSLDELSGKQLKGVDELQKAVKQIMALIAQISDQEKQNNEKAKELLDTLGKEIKKLNQGKVINSAYTPGPVKALSYFIDKKK